MTRFLDSLAGTLAGLLLGVLLAAAIAPHAWEIIPTASSAPESIPAVSRPDEGLVAKFGLVMVSLLKAACTVALMAAVLMVRKPRLRALTAVFAISFGLLGTLGNVTAWLRT